MEFIRSVEDLPDTSVADVVYNFGLKTKVHETKIWIYQVYFYLVGEIAS